MMWEGIFTLDRGWSFSKALNILFDEKDFPVALEDSVIIRPMQNRISIF